MAVRRPPARPPARTPARTPARNGPPRDSLAHKVAETQRQLLRALARRVDEGQFGVDDAVDVTLVLLGRAGGPRLSVEQRTSLRRSLLLLARMLAPPSPRALYSYARDAARLAWEAERPARSPGATLRDVAHGDDVESIARAAIYAELLSARDDDDLVRRAVHRAIQERRRGQPGVPVPLHAGDPLRGLLDLPSHGRLRLPRRDLRGAIARVAHEEPALGDVLRKSARFARHILEPALGPELWLLCRPVGFVDKAETRVLVAAENSLAGQETQLRSRELVYRLKSVVGFERVDAVRVVVDARAFRGEAPPTTATTTATMTATETGRTHRRRPPR
jgi:hypothetical protein